MNQNIINLLKREHLVLLGHTRDLGDILAGSGGLTDKDTRIRISATVGDMYRLLKSHGELENERLYPALRIAFGEETDWMLGMTEMQDEMILNEAKRLYDFATLQPSSVLQNEFELAVANLIRWIGEHVAFEEEKLFPRYPGGI